MKDKKLITIFLLGFSSGLPFLLILSTLSIWLTESGISKTSIGIFSWVTIPYALKFIVAPFIDKIKLPFLYAKLGQRRSWIILMQILLILSIFLLASTDPIYNLKMTAIFALLVGIFSAGQDIVIEAYRIELIENSNLGAASSASVLGYRAGMFFSGSATIYLSAFFDSWAIAYYLTGLLVLVGITTVLISKEPTIMYPHMRQDHNTHKYFKNLFFPSIKSFLEINQLYIIIPFIICFKLADTILNSMSAPFLLDLGFNKVEIANVSKTFGITAMIIGGLAGGVLLQKKTLRSNLLYCTYLQILACILYLLQAVTGYNITMLFLTMGVENFTCGMSQVALVFYLSKLCSIPYTAMHYAILSSFASFVRVSFSNVAGYTADHLSWVIFYSLVLLSCVPTLLILFSNNQHFKFNNTRILYDY